MKTFAELGVKEAFIEGLNELNIIKPTEIQEEVIPLLLNEPKDLIGQAQTGTGKTAAYGLPMLHSIDINQEAVQGLVLCPTRELGQQIAKQLFKFTKYSEKIFTEAVYGGAKIDIQIGRLRRTTHIVVATPGRLIDLVKRKAVDLSQVKTIVLDEADEMLSMGFKKELDEILGFVKSAKQKWLFSATIPEDIKQIIDTHMSDDAHKIEVSKKEVVNKNIKHQFYVCEKEEKLHVLLQLINSGQGHRGMVFCRTKAMSKTLVGQLKHEGVKTDAIHGDLLQKERDKVLRAFRNKKLQILVATDIAARGLDIQGLSYVVHFQLPDNHEFYTHRSGRTARAGQEGISFCLVLSEEVQNLRKLENKLNIKFKQIR